jgi:hypothetical protein
MGVMSGTREQELNELWSRKRKRVL